MNNLYRTKPTSTDIASKVANIWSEHEIALDQYALPYLDSLMDAIVAKHPIDPESLITKIYTMVPGVNRGTARRLVNLKFGNPHRTEILAAPSSMAA